MVNLSVYRRRLGIGALATALLVLFFAGLPVKTASAKSDVTVLIGLRGEKTSGESFTHSLRQAPGLRAIRGLREFTTTNPVVRLTASADDPARFRDYLRSLPAVRYVEDDVAVRAFFTPNDPDYSAQWNLAKVSVETAWNLDTAAPEAGGDPSVVVAVLDTGVAYETTTQGATTYVQAPDFAATTFVTGTDVVHNDAHPNDDNGHGTHVAATIAESTNNGIAGAGIAFNTGIMPVKVLDEKGIGAISDVVTGITFAVDNGAEVINLSLGSVTPSQTLQDAVTRALQAGIVVVAAAGNDGRDSLSYPAVYNGVISVSALGRNDTLASYSNYGTGLSISAPGGDGSDYIWQQTFSNLDAENLPREYSTFGLIGFQGTSQAAPHVAGAAALLLAAGASGNTVRATLQNTATDLGTAGYDTQYGYGRLNIGAALLSLTNDVVAPVVTATVSPATADGNEGYYKTKPTITLSAVDEAGGSGVAAVLYHWGTDTDATYSTPITAPEGLHTLSFFGRDAVGNASAVQTLTLNVDSVGPTITIMSPTAPTAHSPVTITGTVTDETSGVASLLLSDNTVALGTDGSFTTTSTLRAGVNPLTFTATDRAGAQTVLTKEVTRARPVFILGANESEATPTVLRFSRTGAVQKRFLAFAKAFRGGVRIASGDLNGKDAEEIVAVAGAGSTPMVKIFSSTGKLVGQFLAFSKTMREGMTVAVGDVHGKGSASIVVAPGPGTQPKIRVFDDHGKRLAEFLAYEQGFRGGVSVAAGDVDADGVQEIIVAPGPGRAPYIRIFDRRGKLQKQFLAFSATMRNGLQIAAGDVDGNGTAELLVGAGEGSLPSVRVFSATGRRIASFLAYGSTFRGGVRVAAGDVDGDGIEEIIVGPGKGGGPQIRALTKTGRLVSQFFAFPTGFRGGVNVAVTAASQ